MRVGDGEPAASAAAGYTSENGAFRPRQQRPRHRIDQPACILNRERQFGRVGVGTGSGNCGKPGVGSGDGGW
jgi:hypothetical protein